MKIEFYGLPVVKLTNDALFVWINEMTKKECFDWIAENKPTFIYCNSENPIEFAAVCVFEVEHIMGLYFHPYKI